MIRRETCHATKIEVLNVMKRKAIGQDLLDLIEDFTVRIKTGKVDMCKANVLPEDTAAKGFVSPAST
jgi:hypothetical protein